MLLMTSFLNYFEKKTSFVGPIRVCGLSLQPIGCTSALACVVQSYCTCSCRLWRYINVMTFAFCLYCLDTFVDRYGSKNWKKATFLQFL